MQQEPQQEDVNKYLKRIAARRNELQQETNLLIFFGGPTAAGRTCL
jgi:hypothetical protein